MITFIVILAWLGIGFIVGVFVTSHHIAVHGDPEINERIKTIREQRVELEENKARVVVSREVRVAILKKFAKVLKELEVDDSKITTTKTDQRRTDES